MRPRESVEAIAASLPGTIATIVIVSAASILIAVLLFRLSIGGAIAVYFVVWWTVLFVVLPFGAGRGEGAAESVAGAERGAPARPRLSEKAIWTTIVSGVVFVLVAAVLPLAGL